MENLRLRNEVSCGCVVIFEIFVWALEGPVKAMGSIKNTEVELCEKHQKDL